MVSKLYRYCGVNDYTIQISKEDNYILIMQNY